MKRALRFCAPVVALLAVVFLAAGVWPIDFRWSFTIVILAIDAAVTQTWGYGRVAVKTWSATDSASQPSASRRRAHSRGSTSASSRFTTYRTNVTLVNDGSTVRRRSGRSGRTRR